MMIFVINTYSVVVRQGWQEEEGVRLCLFICKFLFPSRRMDDKTGWCEKETGMLGNVKCLVL
jgi:hypothetical protein